MRVAGPLGCVARAVGGGAVQPPAAERVENGVSSMSTSFSWNTVGKLIIKLTIIVVRFCC